jgi:hypothetical protein
MCKSEVVHNLKLHFAERNCSTDNQILNTGLIYYKVSAFKLCTVSIYNNFSKVLHFINKLNKTYVKYFSVSVHILLNTLQSLLSTFAFPHN